jgi:hypothetical protein
MGRSASAHHFVGIVLSFNQLRKSDFFTEFLGKVGIHGTDEDEELWEYGQDIYNQLGSHLTDAVDVDQDLCIVTQFSYASYNVEAVYLAWKDSIVIASSLRAAKVTDPFDLSEVHRERLENNLPTITEVAFDLLGQTYVTGEKAFTYACEYE